MICLFLEIHVLEQVEQVNNCSEIYLWPPKIAPGHPLLFINFSLHIWVCRTYKAYIDVRLILYNYFVDILLQSFHYETCRGNIGLFMVENAKIYLWLTVIGTLLCRKEWMHHKCPLKLFQNFPTIFLCG